MTALPPLASGALPPQSATPAATLAILEAPADLNALPVGARLAGAVVAAVDGTVTIKTKAGTIIALPAIPLQKDALVSMLVQTAAPDMVLRIIQVIPPAPMQAQPAAFRGGLAGGQAAATPAVAMAKPAGAAGIQVEAIVLRPLAGAAFIPAGGPASATDAGPAARPMFPADTRLALRMLDSGPGGGPAQPSTGFPGRRGSSSSPFGAGLTITASVLRTDGANRPLLTSPAGLLMLTTPIRLPHEWSGAFEILGASPPPDPASDEFAPQDTTDGSRTGHWRTLEDVLGSLSRSDPQAARHMSETVLPQPASSLAANLLKVFGLLRGGDVRKWIGNEAYHSLARTRPDLLERLAGDIQKLAPGADGSAGGDWRTFTIPVLVDGALAAIRMRIRSGARQNEEDGASESESDSTRFVLDLTLSRLGRMQIDGLVQARGKQLDLIVRTERPLAADVQGGIRHILLEAGAVTGLRGAAQFRAAPAPFLDADTLPPANGRLRSSLLI